MKTDVYKIVKSTNAEEFQNMVNNSMIAGFRTSGNLIVVLDSYNQPTYIQPMIFIEPPTKPVIKKIKQYKYE